MNDNATLRSELRGHGIVSASCHGCSLFDVCGGIQPERALLNCFDLACCGTGECDRVCPYKPADFVQRLREVRGLRFNDLKPVSQSPIQLPRYVPVVYHRYRRHDVFDYPMVALDTYRVIRLKRQKYQTVASNPLDLRSSFGLAPGVQVILRGTARDPFLERYWQYSQRDDAARQLAALGISLVIPPNFSHFLRVPRTDNLFNRKRQLICIEEMHEAGLTVAPHLSAVTHGDWDFWLQYLRDNPSIRYVSKEFQTGNKNSTQGRLAINAIASLQDALGRLLHPVIIGGSQFAEFAAARFRAFTLIDAVPFAKTAHRRRFDLAAGKRPWRETWTLIDQGLDYNLKANVSDYAAWIETRCSMQSCGRVASQGELFLGPTPVDPSLAVPV
jgi:Domain of unknown function (DUF4417)